MYGWTLFSGLAILLKYLQHGEYIKNVDFFPTHLHELVLKFFKFNNAFKNQFDTLGSFIVYTNPPLII